MGGRKRWQISGQEDVSLVDGAPLKILQRFDADQTWELGHGDMLYLPPKYAHYGVALEPGMTYSIGFRAPTRQEMVTQFLVYLPDRIVLRRHVRRPQSGADCARPAASARDMVERISAMLQAIQWDRDTVTDFLGHYLTEPKAHVFDAPEEELDEDEFAQALAKTACAWI